ncbi:enoyl-CoA hydratase/isomerase family protein [Ornithinimicrobium tianjinense]|uniref:Enoyl-CoA hydratase n=1 Tax=Ornithinimicrobium tianjinense TaxID=1195761 RepID=A0A917BF24_9MICO|nr:enoyl-CoA hydratase/isomerase family protein [Ornithinimicrobium tianjinense]GGF40469.1 enoyl-CoA hydratase [Ornithinimicrobium tianjinense]
MEGHDILVEKQDGVLTVTFNRVRQRNAMTWEMYHGLYDACEQADADPQVRVMVLRSSSEKAFIAGTDIAHFQSFDGGQDGLTYETSIGRCVNRLEDVDVPTVAAIQGYCVGGGLAIASVCDLRVATPSARFGAPIARTLGNCLSMNTYSILLSQVGPSVALDMLLRARMVTGEEAKALGYVAELVEDESLEACLTEVTDTLLAHAPLSMWAAKESLRRFRRANVPWGDDIVQRVYSSRDFEQGVEAFTSKGQPSWEGR